MWPTYINIGSYFNSFAFQNDITQLSRSKSISCRNVAKYLCEEIVDAKLIVVLCIWRLYILLLYT